MLEIAERLEAAGHAYLSEEGNLYYAVATFPGYGALSGNTLDELRAGHRTAGHVEHDKRDPADFALWKAAGEGRVLRWPSRWGEGYPGWHLECSAMALRYLGPRFDIHTGGIDNVFPHHEDEIAQSAPLVGGPPAAIWAHGEHLLMGGRKMAKSAGNFARITELAERGIDPLAFRYLVLTSRYRHKLDYTDESLGGAAAALASLRARLRALGPAPDDGPWAAPEPLRAEPAGDRPAGVSPSDPAGPNRAHEPAAPLSAEGRALHDRFVAAIDDDLDLPTALALVREVLRAAIDGDERRWLVLDADVVLGLDLNRVWDATVGNAPGAAPADPDNLPAPVRTRLVERTAAREARDFARADELRDELAKLGWDVVDEAAGSHVRSRTPGS
jgi:cysteinyl-tRNA synthetase